MLSVLFVDDDAPGGGDGLGWSSAFNDLQDALSQAEMLNGDGDSGNDIDAIWIAEGAYKPSAELEPGDARSASFSLVDGVTLYGGFVGTEMAVEERDWSVHVTTLSGDIGVVGNAADNAYTVVYSGNDITAGLDGVTVTAGNADRQYASNAPQRTCGGGIFNSIGTLTVTNSTLSSNSAIYGGGIYNGFYGTLIITNSMLSANSASRYGGAIRNDNSGRLTVTNSTLSGNSASRYGGGVYNGYSGTLAVTNSTLSGNSASRYGGGIYNGYSGTLAVTNSTLSGNSAIYGGGICNDNSGTLTVTNSLVSSNSASRGGAIYNDAALPGTLTVTNGTLSNNSAQEGGGIYNRYDGTLTVNNSIVAQNEASHGSDVFQVVGMSFVGSTPSSATGPTRPH